jgi:hypothetical protein
MEEKRERLPESPAQSTAGLTHTSS